MRLCTIALALALCSSTAHATLSPVSSFGSNPGGLQMFEYVPANLPTGRPLVVVLHGCTQTASSMEAAGWNALADQYQFAVMYPQQTSSNNPVECFNWAGNYGNPADLMRGMGENESIIQMIDYEVSTHHVDTHKVYVVGFSAGAAFVEVMAATWPDRIAAAAVMSGVPYMCATSVNAAYQCQNPGTSKTAAQWGDLVRAAYSFAGPYPRIQVWHGTSDTTVAPMNMGESVKQWTNVFGIDATADETEMIGSAGTRTAYKNASGQIVVETYSIQGMSHATVVGAEGAATCPATAGSYFEDHKVCSTLRAAKFFGVVPGGSGSGSGSGSGAGGSPYVGIVSPSDGETVSGQMTIVVAAGGDAGIAHVEVAVDSHSLGTDDAAPYQFTWDASGAGPHTIVATATDASGQIATAMATVTVAGPGGGGGGSNGEGPGTGDLPACSLNAGRAGAEGWAPIAFAAIIVVRVRRRRRRA